MGSQMEKHRCRIGKLGQKNEKLNVNPNMQITYNAKKKVIPENCRSMLSWME